MAYCGRPARKSVVIHNGIRLGQISHRLHRDQRCEIRRELGLPETATIAAMVAALSVRKGVHDFIKAAVNASAVDPLLHFAIVGDGEERTEAERSVRCARLSERVHFLGRRSDVLRILPAFDIYVQPSHYEGLSISMLEALATGLPMVTTRVGGVDDVLPGEEGALFVNVGDNAALAASIASLSTDPARRDALTAMSRERVRSAFAVDQMYGGYRALYAALLAGR
jgi:glycosyltransferase involved in cell wall biosynthesis